MSTPTQARRYLQVETSLGRDALILTRASGQERLGGLFEISLEFTRQSGELELDELLGTPATLGIHNAPDSRKGGVAHSRYFNGYFSRIAFAGYGAEGQALFHATLVPWLWFLTRTSDCRIFQQMSVPEIIEKVFRDAGFEDFKKDLRGHYPPREFCVQYRETDFNFVSRLMECEGIYYHFEHDHGSHKLRLCDDMVCHRPDPQHELIQFIGGAEARDRKGVITDWSFSRQVKPGKFAHNDFNFTTPTPDPNLRLLARASAPTPQKPQPFEIYDNLGGYGTVADGNRYARLRMEELIADRETAQARTDLIGFKAGCKFKLQKHPIAPQNREYLITAVNWSAAEGGYGSGSADGGDFFDCDFSCIPADCTFRPTRTTPLPKIEGPQTATVCGPPGEEIHVDNHARVKVQFHWDRYGKSDAGSSCWIRVSQPWAGGSFGGMAIPRIGHEVIVEFIEADPDRPIITGRVYNGKNMPHASNSGRDGKPGNTKPSGISQAAMMTSFKSNSLGGSGGHNEITMNDAGGAETLFFKAQKDEIHNVGNDREDTVANNETRKVGVDRSREVGNNEKISVGNNETRKVGVDRSREVGNNETVSVGSNRTVSVGANQTETVGASQSITVAMMKTETVGINSAETIGAAKELTIGAAYAITVGAIMNTAVGLAQFEEVGTTKKIVVGDSFEIICGSSKIHMDKSGKIKITGKEIEISGSDGVKVVGKVVDIN
jgi:type VI secretion system secreted protein VgrG